MKSCRDRDRHDVGICIVCGLLIPMSPALTASSEVPVRRRMNISENYPGCLTSTFMTGASRDWPSKTTLSIPDRISVKPSALGLGFTG